MSDAIWWVLQPSGLAVAGLVLAWLLLLVRARALALALLTLLLAAGAAVVALPVAELAAAPLEARHPPPARLPDEVEGILVLGGAVDWRVSEARGQLNLGASAERMVAGAALARRYPDATLVLTGVGPEALPGEFAAAPGPRAMFFGPGWEGRDPVYLAASSSTYEDALLALERLSPGPGETWLLVTSAWHMPRAWATFRTLGWTTVPYPVDHVTTGRSAVRPSLAGAGERLALLDRVAREWGAIWIYRRTGRIAPEAWEAAPSVPPPAGTGLRPAGLGPVGFGAAGLRSADGPRSPAPPRSAPR